MPTILTLMINPGSLWLRASAKTNHRSLIRDLGAYGHTERLPVLLAERAD